MGETRVTVWVDREALEIETRVGREMEQRVQPEADAAIRHLVEADCRVVMFGRASAVDVSASDGLPSIESLDGVPDDATGWLVTANATRCGEMRARSGLRTILVGPSDPDRNLAHRPADFEARDLLDAALVILAADAMPDPGQAVGA
ncbi:MAG TPA: hypothetical protein VIZ22_07665 [Candidatus Limnocylindrales bacterium]